MKIINPLAEGFIRSVQLFPDRPCICIQDQVFTYTAFSAWVNFAASAIRSALPGHQPAVIGIVDNADEWTYATMIATALTGHTILAVNPTHPAQRITTILQKTGCALLCTSKEAITDSLTNSCRNTDTRLLTFPAAPTSAPTSPLLPTPQDEKNIAYIIFTSGTTGSPKGVPISLQNINAFFCFISTQYNFTTEDRFLQVYDNNFDVAVFSTFMPFLVGACCYPLAKKQFKFVQIIQLLEKHAITVISMVPGMLYMMLPYLTNKTFPTVRYSFFSGDILYHDKAVSWTSHIPHAVLHNMYGPTETTIVCTSYPFTPETSAHDSHLNIVPLGYPFTGMHTLIVNDQNQPLPIGETGELCFAGPQVILHYLQNENEDRFFEHTTANATQRYYKTGDLAFATPTGLLLFCGRKDQQVKINGYRIDLLEIEKHLSRLTGHPAAVVCKETSSGKSLYAFVVTTDQNMLEKLPQQLTQLLPDYMIPRAITAIPALPLNNNQKIDRRQLLLQYTGT